MSIISDEQKRLVDAHIDCLMGDLIFSLDDKDKDAMADYIVTNLLYRFFLSKRYPVSYRNIYRLFGCIEACKLRLNKILSGLHDIDIDDFGVPFHRDIMHKQ